MEKRERLQVVSTMMHLIFIRYNYEFIGGLIRKVTKGYYNHVVWILDDDYIIESYRKGIFKNPKHKYYGYMYTTQQIQIKNLTQEQKNI